MTDLSRRQFLARAGGTVLTAAAIAAVPDLLTWRGWYDEAVAQEPDVVLDTFNGLAAMLWPGDDAYSEAQGVTTDGPGAIATNAGRHIREALDIFVPAPDGPGLANDGTVPLSGGIASMINVVATSVNPVGGTAPFPSTFARLSFDDKVETWRRLEEETRALDSSSMPEPFAHSSGVLQFVFGVLPGFVQFFAFSEIDVWDPAQRALTGRPVGWDHASYLEGLGTTTPEGWDEFLGYYQNRRSVG
ncbi:MAG: hypothetical protein KY457_04755 [Actinobacteria bacterium]|nr:hypothetical protein [Actinomycetota bacterium]